MPTTLNPATVARVLRDLEAPLPRYTSYPTADRFDPAVGLSEYLQACERSNGHMLPSALSLYIHVPFCRELCFYCGCNKLVTKRFEKTRSFLDVLECEIAHHAACFDADRRVDQIHLGGGTPTYLNDDQLARVLASVRDQFLLADSEREFSIEIDPRTVDPSRLERLAALGFNRFSLGIQDFDPQVQRAVNRIQDFATIERLMTTVREQADISVNFDLIYGLPHQSMVSFADTVTRTIALRPDRVALFRYAHLPQRFKAQRLLEGDRPSLEERLRMFADARMRLSRAGYVAIGLDHFALADDELARAWVAGTLQRNFQGYSTRSDRDLIGLGPSAISRVGDCYVQNELDYNRWLQTARTGFAFVRGISLSEEDTLRARIIEQIMCSGSVDLDARVYRALDFSAELPDLQALAERRLIEIDGHRFTATEVGLLGLRQFASVFDRYLRESPVRTAYSQAV